MMILVEAIVVLAYNDYVKALQKKDRHMINDCERFFKSTYFSNMYDIDGQYFLDKAKQEVRNGKKQRKIHR